MQLRHIDLPGAAQANKMAFSVTNVLTPCECQAVIASSERAGYEPATINVGFGRQISDESFRNSMRCMIDSPPVALILWERVKHFLPKSHFRGQCQAVGLNELRFLKYSPGEHFAPHFDGAFQRMAGPRRGERSRATIMIYLNGEFEGGATEFLNPRRE